MGSKANGMSSVYFPPRLLAMGLGEVLIIGGCFVLAAILRLGSAAPFVLRYQRGFLKLGLICVVFVFFLYLYDLYESRVFSSGREFVSRTWQALGSATIALGLIYYLYPPLAVGRGIFTLGITSLGFALVGYRSAFLWLSSTQTLRENTLILGDAPLARELAREIQNRSESGLRLVGLVSENGWVPGASASQADEPQVVGTIQGLLTLATQQRIRRLIVAMQERRGKLPLNELLRLKAQGITIEDGIDAYESLTGKLAVAGLTPGWVAFADGFSISRLQQICIRLLSLMLALVGLALTAPLMLLLAILIKLDSPGPIFYRQERVGQHGRTFRIIKFRSMYQDCESNTGPVWAKKNDDRTTRVGKWLRRFYLDELPQFFNVLRGDMSLVGPRPERPHFVEQLGQKIPFYDYRHVVRPGATGWGQVNYGYAGSEMSHMERVQYDLFYCKNRSVGLDLLILFQTVKIMLLARGSR